MWNSPDSRGISLEKWEQNDPSLDFLESNR